jgi:VWFA-related protein
MIARDQKNDQFIADLKPEEIEIYEDGVKQKIASIELVHGGRAYSVIAPPPAPVQEGIILPRNKPTNDTAGRVFIIFIDDLHLDFRQTPRTRKLLQDMLKNLIHDGDMFGITTTGTSSLSIQLTYDRQVLDSAVSRVTGNALKPKEIIEGSQGSNGPTELRHRAHVAFSTAYDLMKNLERLQNRRKAVIYISSGYDFNPFEKGRLEETARRWHVDNADDLQSDPFYRNQQSSQALAESDLVRELAELTRAANRANATLYTIDPRGLVAGQDIDEEVDIQDWNAYLRESQDSLRVLAEETGGIAVVNQNDFNKALKKIDNETTTYYVIGYYSSNPDPAEAHAEARRQGDASEHQRDRADVVHAPSAARALDASRHAQRDLDLRGLRPHRRFEPGLHRLGHLHHFRHHSRQAAHLRIDPAGLPRQRVAGDSAAEQLLLPHVVGRRPATG